MTTAWADFIEQAWNEHGDDPVGVASRLRERIAWLRDAPEQTGGFVRLAEHVMAAHLADAPQLDACLDAIAAVAPPDTAPALARARLTARLLRGEAAAGETGLPAADVVRAHGEAICGLAGRGDVPAARRLLEAARAHARASAPADVDAVKALAASYNNLATQLLDAPRSAPGDALMMEAARLSHASWAEVGTWINAERADYVLALCAAALGDAALAVAHAQSCLTICEQNGADAFERFFAHEAVARAHQVGGNAAAAQQSVSRMRALLPDIDDAGNRAYAQSTLDKLAQTPAA